MFAERIKDTEVGAPGLLQYKNNYGFPWDLEYKQNNRKEDVILDIIWSKYEQVGLYV